MAYTRAQRWTLVTIVNYDTYQCRPEEEGTTEGSIGAGKGQDEGRQRATNEEVKNINIHTGADAQLELVSPEPTQKPKRPAMPILATFCWYVVPLRVTV